MPLVFAVIAVVLAAIIAAWITQAIYAASAAGDRYICQMDERAERSRHEAHSRMHRHRIEDEIEAAISGGGFTARSREASFIAAGDLTKRLMVAMRLLARDARTCCQVHAFTAQMLGCTEMVEVEADPRCTVARGRILELLGYAREKAECYPEFNGKVVLQAIALEGMQGICSECEYLGHAVDKVPPLCRTAMLLNPAPATGTRPNAA